MRRHWAGDEWQRSVWCCYNQRKSKMHKRQSEGKVKTTEEMTPKTTKTAMKILEIWQQKTAAERVTGEGDRVYPLPWISSVRHILSKTKRTADEEKRSPCCIRKNTLTGRIKPLQNSHGRRKIQETNPDSKEWRRNPIACSGYSRWAVKLTGRKRAKQAMTKGKQNVCRELTFHYAVMTQLRKEYITKSKSRSKQQILSKVFRSAKYLTKYCAVQKAKWEFGFSQKAMKSNEYRNTSELQSMKKGSWSQQ